MFAYDLETRVHCKGSVVGYVVVGIDTGANVVRVMRRNTKRGFDVKMELFEEHWEPYPVARYEHE